MNCEGCGVKIKGKVKFCPECGQKITIKIVKNPEYSRGLKNERRYNIPAIKRFGLYAIIIIVAAFLILPLFNIHIRGFDLPVILKFFTKSTTAEQNYNKPLQTNLASNTTKTETSPSTKPPPILKQDKTKPPEEVIPLPKEIPNSYKSHVNKVWGYMVKLPQDYENIEKLSPDMLGHKAQQKRVEAIGAVVTELKGLQLIEGFFTGVEKSKETSEQLYVDEKSNRTLSGSYPTNFSWVPGVDLILAAKILDINTNLTELSDDITVIMKYIFRNDTVQILPEKVALLGGMAQGISIISQEHGAELVLFTIQNGRIYMFNYRVSKSEYSEREKNELIKYIQTFQTFKPTN